MEKPTKQQYSFEVKKEIVERFLAGETAMDLAREFDSPQTNLLRDERLNGARAVTKRLNLSPRVGFKAQRSRHL